jgi:uncharacterized small protein (DUF1192 family)
VYYEQDVRRKDNATNKVKQILVSVGEAVDILSIGQEHIAGTNLSRETAEPEGRAAASFLFRRTYRVGQGQGD